MGKIIGIDLGTTNSCVSIMEGGEPVVINNEEGFRTTPSVVAFKGNGNERLVGAAAKRQAVTNPDKTIYSIKRFMGKNFYESKDEIKKVPYKVIESPTGICNVSIGGKNYTPQEISAMILQKMKKSAEDFTGEKITEAVITVPAYFGDAERKATKEAGEIAGLKVKRIINEPTAAALAYGLDKKNKDEKIAVFDLGGGTFDISILELGDGVFEVKSTNGDTHLGGDNFDEEIIDSLANEFMKEHGIDLRKNQVALQRLKDAAEKAKIELSSLTSTEISLPFICADKGNTPLSLQRVLSRAEFEKICEDLFKKCLEPCKKAIKDSGFSVKDINEVILVGGSTRIPRIQEIVEEFFGKKPNKSVNPDEVVSIGAAIQGGILAGDVKDILLLDVTSLSLGIETMGGVFTKIIEANTTIPTKKSEMFSTAADNQTSVTIRVLQGERAMAADNKQLGIFNLDGIPAGPRGTAQIEVTFDIDSNGILDVSAKDKKTGKEQTVRIEQASSLSKEEIERMKAEADKFKDADEKKKNFANKINEADNIIFETEKQLKEFGDKIPAETKTKIENDLAEMKKAKDNAIATGDISGIDNAKSNLMQNLQSIYQAMNNANNATGNNEGKCNDERCNDETRGCENNDNVKTTEYQEVK